MTATELYDTDGEFQAWVEKWVEDRRPPFPLADWLAERELPLLAKAVQWCIDQGTRKVNMPYHWYGESAEPCGVYPATLVGVRAATKVNTSEVTMADMDWFWYVGGPSRKYKTSEDLATAHWLIEDFASDDLLKFSEPQSAILYMLDHYHEDAQKERERRLEQQLLKTLADKKKFMESTLVEIEEGHRPLRAGVGPAVPTGEDPPVAGPSGGGQRVPPQTDRRQPKRPRRRRGEPKAPDA